VILSQVRKPSRTNWEICLWPLLNARVKSRKWGEFDR
jgi:hypothetical protein